MDIGFDRFDKPAIFINFMIIALFRDFIKGQTAGIGTKERTGNPADKYESDHDHSGDLETDRFHQDGNEEPPNSGGETRDKEGEALCGCPIADREELRAPKLIELLLHRETPDNGEEEEHPHLHHVRRQGPNEPTDDTETGKNAKYLAAIKFITRIHKDERRQDADGKVQRRQEQRHGVRELAEVFVNIRHEEPIRAGCEIPERINGTEHDHRFEAGTVKDIPIMDLTNFNAFCRKFLFTFVGFCPFRRFRHLQTLIPNPAGNDDQMGKDDTVAEKTEHRIERNGCQKDDNRAEHPSNLG